MEVNGDTEAVADACSTNNICFNNQIALQITTLVHRLNANKVGSNLHDRQICAPSDNGSTSCPDLYISRQQIL
jgi:hypothetical protein